MAGILEWWVSLKPEAQAAWAQAILSTVAVAIAIGVPLWTARRDDQQRARDARRRARSIAIQVLPILRSVRAAVDIFLEGVMVGGDRVKYLSPEALVAAQSGKRLHPLLTLLVDLGEPGLSSQQAVYELDKAANMIDTAIVMHDFGVQQSVGIPGHVEELMRAAVSHCARAEDLLEALYAQD